MTTQLPQNLLNSLSTKVSTCDQGWNFGLEKLSRVKVLEDAWRTAPNHSRPASCVVDADIDAEDHPGGEPQNGQ